MYHLFNIFRKSACSKNDYRKNKQKQNVVPAQKVVTDPKKVDKQFSAVPHLHLSNLSSFLRCIINTLSTNTISIRIFIIIKIKFGVI